MAGNPLESLSDNDLQALKKGDMSLVSDAGLMTLKKFSQVKAEGNVQKPPTPFRSSGETKLSAGEEFLANPYGRAAVGAVKPVIGTGQLALNAIGQGEGINREMANLQSTTDKAREYVGSRGVDLADAVGQTASMAIPTSMMGNTASTLGRMGQGALVGASAGAATPVADLDNFWRTKMAQIGLGGTVGMAIPGAWEGAKALGRGTRNVVQPHMGNWGADQAAGRLANSAAGDKADDIINLMRQNQPSVPGSNATAGQASVPANRAEFNALQELAAAKRPSDYSGPLGIEGEQNAARLAALRTVGQTPQALASAEAARTAQGVKDYAVAFQQTVKADPTLMRMAQNPFFKEAVSDATRLAQANGIDPKNALTQYLHYVKISLDKQLGRTGDTALASTEKRAVENLQNQLTNWMGSKNPAYETARSNFETASKPINQMEVGQYLENKLQPALSEDAKQRAATYSQALRDAPGTIKRSTGQPAESLTQVMRPDQLETLRKVQTDLARNATHESLAKAGNKAAEAIIDKNIGKAPPSGMFSPVISVARGAYNRMAGGASEKTMNDLAIIMKDPSRTADVMEKAKPFERQLILDELMRINAAGASSLQSGALSSDRPRRGALSQ